MKGIGCDIVEVARIKGVLDRHPDSFLKKAFTDNETDYCLSMKEPARHLAARFAAKEAVAKALGTGFGQHLSFLDIEVVRESNGQPSIHLSDQANQYFKNPSFHLSLSHEKNYALAFVVIN